MTTRQLSLFLFVDAMGWEVIQRHPELLSQVAPNRKRLETIFGYSSACDPSIISGKLPNEHGLWSSFYYSPETSPFANYSWMKWLPSIVMDNHRVRSRISQMVAKSLGYTGYVQLYNVPFEYLPYFDYAEKKRIYTPGGLPGSQNIFDILVQRGIPYHMCAPGVDDATKINTLIEELNHSNVDMAYVTLGQLDALMHRVGTHHPSVLQLLQWYEQQIMRIMDVAKRTYDEVALYIFADHGMHDVVGEFDLQKEVSKLGLTYGVDFAVMYDSTMARFWFLNEEAKVKIHHLLKGLQVGEIVSDQELQEFGVFFKDGRYGDTIFLMRSGWLIVPSFMGHKRIPGMHGYHPKDEDSYAGLLSNRDIPASIQSIHHIFHLMPKG